MSEIPDDVMKAAQAVVLWAYSVPPDETEHIKNVAIAILSERERAILAERERCARLALSAPTLENKTKMFGSQINELYAMQENLKRLIALYIREGSTT